MLSQVNISSSSNWGDPKFGTWPRGLLFWLGFFMVLWSCCW